MRLILFLLLVLVGCAAPVVDDEGEACSPPEIHSLEEGGMGLRFRVDSDEWAPHVLGISVEEPDWIYAQEGPSVDGWTEIVPGVVGDDHITLTVTDPVGCSSSASITLLLPGA